MKQCVVKMLYVCFIGLHVLYLATPSLTAGSCPPTLPVDVCGPRCGTNSPCRNSSQLCCPTACGGAMCVDPVTERHFVTQEKPGRCPEYPRGHWICTDMCTGDADCPRALKCCANRCGAQTCQRPDPAETATVDSVEPTS